MRVSSYVPSEEIFQTGSTSSTNEVSSTNGLQSFKDVLSGALDSVNDAQVASNNMTNAFVSGDDVQISDVMLASEEAKISLQFAVQVRNKILDAYKEITNIQL